MIGKSHSYSNMYYSKKDQIENGNRECVKETTTRPNSRLQPKFTNGSSMQRETPAPGSVLKLAPKQKCILVQW